MADKKCVRIEMEYDNGEVWVAEGEDAETIRRHWEGGEVFAHLHGAMYTGPVMKPKSITKRWDES